MSPDQKPTPDTQINLTEQSLTVEVRAAMHPEPAREPLDLDAVAARVPTGYEGPWYVHQTEDGRWLVGYPTDCELAGLVATVPDYGAYLAEFIAAARTDVPALVAEVRSLRAENAEHRRTIRSWQEARQADIDEGQPAHVADDAAAVLFAADLTREYHWGRAWSPSPLEASCPCPKAPCGYVIRSAENQHCGEHNGRKTMRGGHHADRCPGGA